MNEDLKSLLVLNRLKGFGIQTLKALLRDFDSPSEIMKACFKGELRKSSANRTIPEKFRGEWWPDQMDRILDEENPEEEFQKCSRLGVRILGYGQEGYPKALYQLYDPPLILYVRGSFFPDDFCSLAIVGTRDPSPYGMETTRKFASFFSQSGITIISGFARGIDSQAHKGALDGKGSTIAILGCGVDTIYPQGNEELYHRILEKGALISEYPLGTPPLANHFPRRNRLISGLGLGVLVVEAHEKSGSLITATLALEQGKEVFAIPGRIDSLRSRGTNRLIKQGACLVECPEDIILELAPLLKNYAAQNVSGDVPPPVSQDDPVVSALHKDSLSLEELVGKTELGPAELSSRLTLLEIRRKVRKLPDGKFSLVPEN